MVKILKIHLIKKMISLSLILCLLFALLPFTAVASNDIKVLLNGTPITFDIPPQIVAGRTLVPMRAIFEAFGAEVSWREDENSIYACKGSTIVIMNVGKKNYLKNDKTLTLDVAPQLIESRVFVPVRAVSECFDCNVSWDSRTNTVIIDDYSSNIHSSGNIDDHFKTFYEVMRSYWQTWKYDDSPDYFLNNINDFIDVQKPDVTAVYDTEKDEISFIMEHRTEDCQKSISIDLDLNYKNNSADVSLFLYPICISGKGSIDKESFGGSSILNLEFSNSNRINSICNQIVKDSLDLTLKIVDEFLANSKTSLRVKDLGFKKFDATQISINQIESKIFTLYDLVEDENLSSNSNSNSNSNSSLNSSSNYYVYKGTTVPCYDDISGDDYLGVDDGYRVYEYSRKGLKKYLSFLDEHGFSHDKPYYGVDESDGFEFYLYYDSGYIIYIAKTNIYTNGNLIDVIKLEYKIRK